MLFQAIYYILLALSFSVINLDVNGTNTQTYINSTLNICLYRLLHLQLNQLGFTAEFFFVCFSIQN